MNFGGSEPEQYGRQKKGNEGPRDTLGFLKKSEEEKKKREEEKKMALS